MKNNNKVNMKKIFLAVDRERRDTIDCEKPKYYLLLSDTDKKLEFLKFLNAAEYCHDSAFDYLEAFKQTPFDLREILQRRFSRNCPQVEEASRFVSEQLAHCEFNTTPSSVLANSTLHHNSSTEKDMLGTGLTLFDYTELYVAAGHGIGNGVINALSQQLAAYLINKGYRGSKIKAFALSTVIAIIHSAYAASLPILFENLSNSNAAADEQNIKMWEILFQQVIPIFSTNMAFSVGFQLVNYFQANCLAQAPILQSLVRSIPAVNTTWAVISHPIATASNLATSVVSSAATFTLLSYFFSKPVATKGKIEIKNTTNTLLCSNTEKRQDKLLELLPQPKTYRYITLAELTAIRESAAHLANKLSEFKNLLAASISRDQVNVSETKVPSVLEAYQKSIADKSDILSIVQHELTTADSLRDRLEDNIHQEACKNHTDKREYVAAMEKLGNVFKIMQTHYHEMHNKLNKAVGFVRGSHDSFDEDSERRLNEIICAINFPLSKVVVYISKYNIADTAEKAKKQGAEEALQKIFAKDIIEHPQKMGSFFASSRRPYSEIANYTMRSSGSDESSCSSVNSENDPIVPQQSQLLLK